MPTVVVAIFAFHEVFHAIQAWHLKNLVVQAAASGMAQVTGDVTGNAASTPYVLVSWAGRFNGIAFLLFSIWAYGVLTAVGLWLGTLALSVVVNGLIRITTGYAGIRVVAHLATVAVPVAGVSMWVAALGGL
jgi:hypothetical protein